MKYFSPLLQQVIEAMQCMPGVGPKSAQRIAFHLLKQRDKASHLAKTLLQAVSDLQHCQRCRTYCEAELCQFCLDPKRQQNILCVVETPTDQLVIEQSGGFRGLYFVLLGHLSPLDGIGPNDIGLDLLKQRLMNEPIEEVILATNTTVEGETTAHYIAEMVKRQQRTATRIAYGIPMGGELEYVSMPTINRALNERSVI